jgi:hypothetical protein
MDMGDSSSDEKAVDRRCPQIIHHGPLRSPSTISLLGGFECETLRKSRQGLVILVEEIQKTKFQNREGEDAESRKGSPRLENQLP